MITDPRALTSPGSLVQCSLLQSVLGAGDNKRESCRSRWIFYGLTRPVDFGIFWSFFSRYCTTTSQYPMLSCVLSCEVLSLPVCQCKGSHCRGERLHEQFNSGWLQAIVYDRNSSQYEYFLMPTGCSLFNKECWGQQTVGRGQNVLKKMTRPDIATDKMKQTIINLSESQVKSSRLH